VVSLCSLSGKVEDSRTREGINKTEVNLHSLEPSEDRTVLTDSSGNFVMQGISPGRYEMTVHRVGYFGQVYGSAAAGLAVIEFARSGGRNVDGILVALVPWSVLSGRITDESGDPMVGAEVTALQRAVHWSRGVLPKLCTN
jgi:hypothetical protein